MNCRRQALQFCLDPAVVVVIQICNEFLLEVLHGTELLQIQQLTFEQPDEWTAKEKFWAVMGALKATLLIAGAYLVGLAVLLAVLFWLWK